MHDGLVVMGLARGRRTNGGTMLERRFEDVSGIGRFILLLLLLLLLLM
jgi:hypothetical protein